MYCVLVEFRIKPDCAAAFVDRVQSQRLDSLTEPACRVFDVWTSEAAPEVVMLYEVYDDAAGFDTHLASDHFRRFDAEVAGWVAEKTVQRWDRPL